MQKKQIGEGETVSFATSKDIEILAERFEEELERLTRRISKDARRDVLNFNLLNRFKKEMWVHRIVLSVVGGFAIGVFLTFIAIHL